MKFFYEDVLKAVGEFGPWQVRMILLLWVPMFMCGTQFITTDFMGLEPGQLFCEYEGCTNTNYNSTVFFEVNTKDNVISYSTIFSRIN